MGYEFVDRKVFHYLHSVGKPETYKPYDLSFVYVVQATLNAQHPCLIPDSIQFEFNKDVIVADLTWFIVKEAMPQDGGGLMFNVPVATINLITGICLETRKIEDALITKKVLKNAHKLNTQGPLFSIANPGYSKIYKELFDFNFEVSSTTRKEMYQRWTEVLNDFGKFHAEVKNQFYRFGGEIVTELPTAEEYQEFLKYKLGQ